MGKANTTHAHVEHAHDESTEPKMRKPALRKHTFGTWEAIHVFHASLPKKRRYYPTIDEIVAQRERMALTPVSRQAVHKHLDLLEKAGKIVRKPEGRRDITWCEPFDLRKAEAEFAELTGADEDDDEEGAE